jgi:hypothetical protein
VTTTDSAQAAPATVVESAERLGARSPAAVRAERRAWLILWVAFATFCALVFSGLKFAVDYVSTAQVDQSAVVTTSRGRVFVTAPGSAEKAVLARTELGVGTVVALDRDSDASLAELRLFDQSTLKVLAGATLELSRMEVGRFIKQQRLVLGQSAGVVQFATVGPIDVELANGGVAHLAAHSDVTVWIDTEGKTRVLVYDGEARLELAGQFVTVPRDKRAVMGTDGRIGVFDRSEQLLPNGDFARQDEGWQRHDVPGNPLIDVNGQRFWVSGPELADQKLTALRVLRENSRLEHGETGLIRNMKNLDVSGYRHLWLKAYVRVDYASLSGGGYLGSEYPMMLRMTYEGPREGSEPGPWSVGFYVANPDNRPAPQGRAEQWPAGEWQPFLVDLTNTDASNVPYRLREFSVMGQGHNYDARVAGLELIGE